MHLISLVFLLLLVAVNLAAPLPRDVYHRLSTTETLIQESEHNILSNKPKTLHRGPITLAEDAKLTYTITPHSDSALFQLQVTNSKLLNSTKNERVWIAFGFGEPGSGSFLGADIATVEFYVGDVNKCDIVDRYVPFAAYPLDEQSSNATHFQVKEDKVRTTTARYAYSIPFGIANMS